MKSTHNRYLLKIEKAKNDAGLYRYELSFNGEVLEIGAGKPKSIYDKFKEKNCIISFVKKI